MTEQDIVALFFARDERAIAEFDRSIGALCYKIALDLTGDPGAAEECLNDTRLPLRRANRQSGLSAYRSCVSARRRRMSVCNGNRRFP